MTDFFNRKVCICISGTFIPKVFIYIVLTGFCTMMEAQVTVGSNIEPGKGALLELKERTPPSPGSDNSTADRGMVFPRVTLTSNNDLFPMFQPGGPSNYQLGGTQYAKTDEDRKHAGMIVFNVATGNGFVPGLYIWDGSEWRKLDDSPVIAPDIDGLMCLSWTLVPNSYQIGTPYEGILKIPYTGGNGGPYPATTSITLANGLNIERIAGKLAIGGGEVMYRIYGIPTVSSPTTTAVPINFLDKTCNLTIGASLNMVPIQYVKKSFGVNANTTTNSEMSFGHLMVRMLYDPSHSSGNRFYPQFSVTPGTPNTRALIWLVKAGTGLADQLAYEGYAQLALANGKWKSLATDGLWYKKTEMWDDITIGNRDFGLIYVMLQHNNLREIYRITVNAYKDIAAGTGGSGSNAVTVAKVDNNCTVFIELLE